MKSLRIAIYLSIFLRFARRILSSATSDGQGGTFCICDFGDLPYIVVSPAMDNYGPADDARSRAHQGYYRFRKESAIAALSARTGRSVISLREAADWKPCEFGFMYRKGGPSYPHTKEVDRAVQRIRRMRDAIQGIRGQPS